MVCVQCIRRKTKCIFPSQQQPQPQPQPQEKDDELQRYFRHNPILYLDAARLFMTHKGIYISLLSSADIILVVINMLRL
jgi:hypothetical protein